MKKNSKEIIFEKEFIEKLIKNSEIRESMISTTDYINWLSDYTSRLKDNFFYADDLDKNIDEEDIEMIKSLHLFYDEIDKYASANYIYPEGDKKIFYYTINYNGKSFKIGFLNGQEAAFFCKKIDNPSSKRFIDFNDILNNKTQDNVSKITSDLKVLSDNIKFLYKEGVPLEALEDTVEHTIDKIKIKK